MYYYAYHPEADRYVICTSTEGEIAFVESVEEAEALIRHLNRS